MCVLGCVSAAGQCFMKCCPSTEGFSLQRLLGAAGGTLMPLEAQMLHSQGSLTLPFIPGHLRYLFSQVSLETGFKQVIRKDFGSKTI